MSKRSVVTLVLLVVGICVALAPAQAGEKAEKTDVVGFLEYVDQLVFGNVWTSGHILHVRDQLYQWEQTASDERLEGDIFNEYNANLDISTPFLNGRVWGKILIEQDGVRVWEGTWNGKFVNGFQQGGMIIHGVGVFEGLKAKVTYQERSDGSVTFDFDAVILDPGGS